MALLLQITSADTFAGAFQSNQQILSQGDYIVQVLQFLPHKVGDC